LKRRRAKGKLLEDLEVEAASLSDSDRAALALRLIESLEPADATDWAGAWQVECDARWALYEQGLDKGTTAADALARARAALR